MMHFAKKQAMFKHF